MAIGGRAYALPSTHSSLYSAALGRDRTKDPITFSLEYHMKRQTEGVGAISSSLQQLVQQEIWKRIPSFAFAGDGHVDPYDEMLDKIRTEYSKEAETYCQRLVERYPSWDKLVQAYVAKELELNAFGERCKEFERMGLATMKLSVDVIQVAINRKAKWKEVKKIAPVIILIIAICILSFLAGMGSD